MLANSWMAFKDIVFKQKFDNNEIENQIDKIDQNIESNNQKGTTNIDGGNMTFTDPTKIDEEKREILLFRKHPIIGFLEYFTPMIFPACLGLWALIQLAAQVWCF